MNEQCKCGMNKSFEQCCGPLLSGRLSAETPEQLMRSRYCAFVFKNAGYLLQSHLPSAHAVAEQESLRNTFSKTEWLGLRILHAVNDHRDQGQVEFVAFYRDDQYPLGQIHELSQFVRREHSWFYLSGQFLPPIKLQRNERCICGSGKKFKHCCAV